MVAATATERRRRLWTCASCSVAVRREVAGCSRAPRWRGNRCVACQRKAASKEDGQEGLLRFELLRGTSLMKAAKQAHVTVPGARRPRRDGAQE